MSLAYGILADAVLILHLGFILFVLLGGLMLRRWPWIPWLHLPAVGWAAFIELSHAICPLTPLENALRAAAGKTPYGGGFIEHYLTQLIYPTGLTPAIQTGLGLALLALNGWLYGRWWLGRRDPPR